MLDFRKNEVATNTPLDDKQYYKTDRGSLVAFMHGGKLAVFAKKLEKMDVSEWDGESSLNI